MAGRLDQKVSVGDRRRLGYWTSRSSSLCSGRSQGGRFRCNCCRRRRDWHIIQAAGGMAMFVKADVSQGNEVERMVKLAVETYGRLDLRV